MLSTTSLPFVLRRRNTTTKGTAYTSTKERLDGLLALKGDELTIEWRTVRDVYNYGTVKDPAAPHMALSETEKQIEPLQKINIPLLDIANARLKRIWKYLPPRLAIVILAQHLRAFEALSNNHEVPGLALDHPAEIILEIRRSDRVIAADFVSAIQVALSEQRLTALGDRSSERLLGPKSDS